MNNTITFDQVKASGNSGIVTELVKRNKILAYSGFFQLALAALFVLFMFLDNRLILSINAWIKPFKFALSGAIYMLTFAWLLYYLPVKKKTHSLIGLLISISMMVEIFLISTQSFRGVTSHFNAATPLDGIIFGLMGIFILLNTVVVIWVLVMFFSKKAEIHPAYLWGIRLGILIFLLASFEGGAMLSNNAHTVGLADGGEGIPLLNWSTRGGDLRIAHFIGIHALQVVPLFGWMVAQAAYKNKMKQPVAKTIAFGVIYATIAFGTFFMALKGISMFYFLV